MQRPEALSPESVRYRSLIGIWVTLVTTAEMITRAKSRFTVGTCPRTKQRPSLSHPSLPVWVSSRQWTLQRLPTPRILDFWATVC